VALAVAAVSIESLLAAFAALLRMVSAVALAVAAVSIESLQAAYQQMSAVVAVLPQICAAVLPETGRFQGVVHHPFGPPLRRNQYQKPEVNLCSALLRQTPSDIQANYLSFAGGLFPLVRLQI
jgi:hypothetical protein